MPAKCCMAPDLVKHEVNVKEIELVEDASCHQGFYDVISIIHHGLGRKVSLKKRFL